jgi:hypothetical protein
MLDRAKAEQRSVEEIEREFWGEPPAGATSLVSTVHRLRQKPICALTAEDLRVLIGQHVGLAVLLPFTLEHLAREPLLEGDYYPGDVLVSVLRVPADYWASHEDQLWALNRIITQLDPPTDSLSSKITEFRRSLALERPGGGAEGDQDSAEGG